MGLPVGKCPNGNECTCVKHLGFCVGDCGGKIRQEDVAKTVLSLIPGGTIPAIMIPKIKNKITKFFGLNRKKRDLGTMINLPGSGK